MKKKYILFGFYFFIVIWSSLMFINKLYISNGILFFIPIMIGLLITYNNSILHNNSLKNIGRYFVPPTIVYTITQFIIYRKAEYDLNMRLLSNQNLLLSLVLLTVMIVSLLIKHKTIEREFFREKNNIHNYINVFTTIILITYAFIYSFSGNNLKIIIGQIILGIIIIVSLILILYYLFGNKKLDDLSFLEKNRRFLNQIFMFFTMLILFIYISMKNILYFNLFNSTIFYILISLSFILLGFKSKIFTKRLNKLFFVFNILVFIILTLIFSYTYLQYFIKMISY